MLLTACELGYGKRTPVQDYRETRRGGKGIINIKVTEKNGHAVGVVSVKPGDQVMLITSSGKLIQGSLRFLRPSDSFTHSPSKEEDPDGDS